MNKMTVIQLLNKIANGEEVPKKIRITDIDDRITRHYNFFYDEDDQEYKDDELFPIGARLILDRVLNNKVEILEEPKGIPEKLNKQHFHNRQRQLANKINKIIDYLDYLESKGE